MKRLLSKLFGGKRNGTVQKNSRRSYKPALEGLEDRLVPAITDMTDLARSVMTTPDAPTHVYLNFDGYQNDKHSVAAYTGNIDQINDIVFRASEMFSPFNVEVSRRVGFNNYDNANGSTTVFIGDDTANNTTNPDGTIENVAHSYTPGQYSDYPVGGNQHVPHSNPYNLAFVDPVAYSGLFASFDGVDQIAGEIGHEAGHTLGLDHILTESFSSVAASLEFNARKVLAPDQFNEMMSYDSANRLFKDETFFLTDLNNDGKTTAPDPSLLPNFDGTPLVTQNSYTFLEQVVGDRPVDGQHHFLHTGYVDANHFSQFGNNWSPDSVKIGNINREGDYDVYQVNNLNRDWHVQVDLTPADGSQLRPVLLIYEDGNLLDYPQAQYNAAGQQEVSLNLHLDTGHSYAFVVFGANGTETGAYRFTSQGTPDMILPDLTVDAVGDVASLLQPQLSPVLSVPAGAAGDVASLLQPQLSPVLSVPAGAAGDVVDLSLMSDPTTTPGGSSGLDAPVQTPLDVGLVQPPLVDTSLSPDLTVQPLTDPLVTASPVVDNPLGVSVVQTQVSSVAPVTTVVQQPAAFSGVTRLFSSPVSRI
jgi:hypothetical protein